MPSVATAFKSSLTDRQRIEKAAEEAGMSLSDYCRTVVLNSLDKDITSASTTKKPDRSRKTIRERALIEDFNTTGTVTGFALRDFHRIFNEKTSLIRILTSYTDLIDSNRRQLKVAIEGKAHLHCLLLDPTSEIAIWRSRGMFENDNYVREGIEHTLLALTELIDAVSESNREKIKVRLYKDLPPMRITQVDQNIYLGFLPLGQRGIQAPHILIAGKDNSMVKFAEEQFELLWLHSFEWKPGSASP